MGIIRRLKDFNFFLFYFLRLVSQTEMWIKISNVELRNLQRLSRLESNFDVVENWEIYCSPVSWYIFLRFRRNILLTLALKKICEGCIMENEKTIILEKQIKTGASKQ